MKRIYWTLLLAACWTLLSGGCHRPSIGGPTPPLPSPSPSPSPRLNLTSLLKTDGHEFRNERNETVYLLGAIGAGAGGDGMNGWPLVSRQVCDQLGANDLNFTLLRIGPFSSNMPQGSQFAWDSPSLLSVAGEAVAYCNSKGVWVQVELFDHWCAQHGCSPFSLDDLASTEQDVYGTVLPAAQVEWVRKVVAALGRFDGVLWVDSNEAFKRPSRDWTMAVMTIVQDEEAKRGYRHHPFGTNNHDRQTEASADFATRHANGAQGLESLNYPILVTEHDEGQSAEETLRQARRARDLETSFNRWRGDLGDGEWKYVLEELGKIRKGEDLQ